VSVDGDHLRAGLDPVATANTALAEFIATLRLQIWMRVFGQAVSAQLAAVVDYLGQPDILGTLLAGAAATEEARIADDLFEVATGARSLDRFIADHGYQGPNSGDPAARVWREDPRPIERLLSALGDAEPPAQRRARVVADRDRTVTKILATLPKRRRALARLAIHLAPATARSIEGTKTSMLRSVDVGRAAARAVGAQMAAAGVIGDTDDVFHLYCDEIARWSDPNVASKIAERKELHATFLAEDFPETWEGSPPVLTRSNALRAEVTALQGLGVSPGIARGRVRIVLDAADDITINNGDILVCPTTDPGWVSLMTLAAALVIDIGAAGSHGAIVARELGVPCVAGTGSGTRHLLDGDIVQVDGSTGTVEVLQRRSAAVIR
jgi:phosphohistidine swiveling domain-containing protein